jgi:type IV secretion system protein VirD4
MSAEKRLWLALGAIAAAVLAGIWLSGALAGWLFGAGFVSIAPGELLATAARLPSHLGDPRLAWPRAARAALPEAPGVYLGAAVVALFFTGLADLGRRIAAELGIEPFGASQARPPSARWATRRELGVLRVRSPRQGRLTLGRSGGRLLAAEERQSVIVVAPSQSGKTTGLAIPALLEWQGPVLATSIKSDLLLDSAVAREELGEVMVFDPTQVTGKAPTRATPLQSARTWRGAMRVAHWLAGSARAGSGGLRDSEFWYASAEKLLAPLLFAAARSGRTMEAVVRWLDQGPEASEAEVAALLEETGSEEAERAWAATQNREERQRSSVFTTAEIILAAFADPRVIEETAAADYTPARLLDGGMNTLYLCAPGHEQERLRTLFAMMISELLAVAYESAAASGRPIDPPLLLVLDEAANIAPIANLDEVASSGAGQGVQLLSVFQDLAQVKARYGNRAETIINNHRAKLFGAGVSDPSTLEYVSRIVGAGEFDQQTHSSGERGHSTSGTKTYRELAPAAAIRSADPGSALLIYGHLPPTKIRLRPWYEEKTLARLGETRPTTPLLRKA